MITLIGIGSPINGDQIGLEAVELLRKSRAGTDCENTTIRWLSLERPGLNLMQAWQGADTVVLIDALLCSLTSQPVQRIEPDTLLQQASGISSHDIGVAEALAMAKALGQLPPRLLIYGITVSEGDEAAATNWLQLLQKMLVDDLQGAVRFTQQ